MYSDHERQTYILPHELPRKTKINNKHITLKLLMTCKIVSILQQCSTNSTLVTFQLPLPPVICCDINEKIDYQRDLYFNSIIEPTVDYKYPNEY